MMSEKSQVILVWWTIVSTVVFGLAWVFFAGVDVAVSGEEAFDAGRRLRDSGHQNSDECAHEQRNQRNTELDPHGDLPYRN